MNYWIEVVLHDTSENEIAVDYVYVEAFVPLRHWLPLVLKGH